MKVYAPNRAYNGLSAGVVFTDGVGSTEDKAALQYFERAGYGMGEDPRGGDPKPDPYVSPTPDEVKLGTPLRDAAVAPLPRDFLPPTNAGEADPHGPLVVSPGLHAVPPAPITPGPVAVDDPAAQAALETAVASAVLVDHVPADQVGAIADAHRASADDDAPEHGNNPPKSAPKGVWVDFAVEKGMDRAEAEAESKAALIERHG